MGNYRFRLSDMMPNAWFYKLKDMRAGRGKNNNSNSNTSCNNNTKNSLNKKKKKQFPPSTSASSQPTILAHTHSSYPRKSYYFTRELQLIPTDNIDDPKLFLNSSSSSSSAPTHYTKSPHFSDPPRKSSKRKPSRARRTAATTTGKVVSSSVSAGCSCRATNKSSDSPLDYSASPSDISPDLDDSFPPEFRSDRVLATESFDEMLSLSSSSWSKLDSNSTDIVIDVDKKSLTTKPNADEVFDEIPEFSLPPIITKPPKIDERRETHQPNKQRKSCSSAIPSKEQRNNGSVRKPFSANSPGVRLRLNSPRIGGRRIHGRKSVSSSISSTGSSLSSRRRRSLSESLAVVKSSFDPQRDFRDSMVEMIVENNIRASKDLEDLLACYLSLNSDEYHDLIIKVFKQIWFDLSDTK